PRGATLVTPRCAMAAGEVTMAVSRRERRMKIVAGAVFAWLLASAGIAPLAVARVEVVDAADGQVLAAFAGEDLQRRLALTGAPLAARDTTVPPGRHGVVYIEWPVHDRRPAAIEHVVTYAAPGGA